jgi:porin
VITAVKQIPFLSSVRLVATGLALAATPLPAADAPSPEEPALEQWWNGGKMTGTWFGVRDSLGDRGLQFNGKYYGAFFGVVDSQHGSRGFWDQGIEFGAEQNFGRLLEVSSFEGMKAFAGFRYRSGEPSSDPNTFVGASGMFNPSNWQSGTQFRVLNFGVEAGSADLLPVKDMVVFRGGWLQPQKEFIDQPLSKLFLNNAVASAKGVGGNIPFSSSASTWGGTLRIKPAGWSYAKAGLFMAFPQMLSTSNHGVAFQGFAADPSQNGLWTMAETGVTPNIGSAALPGKYAVGGYYYGGRKNSFNGTPNYGQFGFYWQADQMLFREPPQDAGVREAPDGKSHAGGKSFKAPVAAAGAGLNTQGLSVFNLVTFAPKYNNLHPFYFHSGLVYRGLIPHRDDDLTMFSLAFGNYSYYNLLEQRENARPTPTYTLFLEWGHRFQINGWAFLQPFVQYAIRPNGTNAVKNATILGISTGATF